VAGVRSCALPFFFFFFFFEIGKFFDAHKQKSRYDPRDKTKRMTI